MCIKFQHVLASTKCLESGKRQVSCVHIVEVSLLHINCLLLGNYRCTVCPQTYDRYVYKLAVVSEQLSSHCTVISAAEQHPAPPSLRTNLSCDLRRFLILHEWNPTLATAKDCQSIIHELLNFYGHHYENSVCYFRAPNRLTVAEWLPNVVNLS